MMRIATVVVLTCALVATGCASLKSQCPDLAGYELTVCEVRAVVSAIKAHQPKAFEVLAGIKAVTTPDLRARIERAEAVWPELNASMDSLVAALEAGQSGDVTNTVARAVAFYVDLSALVVQVGGKALPGLPRTTNVNAVQ